MIKVDVSGTRQFIQPDVQWEKRAGQAHARLESGGDFTGWLHLPSRIGENRDENARMAEAAAKIRSDSDVLLVIGIGGSYLGAKAVTDLLAPGLNGRGTEIIFAGNGLSGAHTARILKYLENRDFSINVISKSGTTTEPAVAFRIFRQLLEKKYGTGAAKRIYATTDKNRGALLSLARENGYGTFVIPDDVGGRYSVLTPVGLLPIAAAGIDTAELVAGAAAAERAMAAMNADNPAWSYACTRQALYESGKKIELLAAWEPEFRFFTEWWKQLFGESEGKQGQGIFPASLELTADLHSMGQYIQQGERILAETFLWAETAQTVEIPCAEKDTDGLNYIAGKSMDYVNRTAFEATKKAHMDGGVPCIEIDMGELNAENTGALIYFFEISCAISGYMSGVCPFDQPGVEAYKKNMFKMLGKP